MQQTSASTFPMPESVQKLLDGLRPLTSSAIHDAFESLPYIDRIESWAALIPRASVEEFPALLDRGVREPFIYQAIEKAVLSAIVRQWAKLDPMGAFEVFRLPLPTLRHSMSHLPQLIAAEEWIKVDPGAALDSIRSVQIAKHRVRLLNAVALLAPPFAMLDDHFETELKTKVAVQAAEHDPVRFLELARSGSFHMDAYVAAFRVLSLADPLAATDRAKALPAQVQRNAAARGIAHGWGHKDPSAALEWSDAIDPDWLREAARAGILEQWILTNPAEARPHVEGHGNYTRRLQLIRLLGKEWAEVDPAATRAWIETDLVGNAQTEAFGGYRVALGEPEQEGQ
jgi:hypothetical protein